MKDPTPDFEDYLENTMKYCPKQDDDVCVKFKTELEEQGIECKGDRAARLKTRLQWKCKNRKIKRGNEKEDKLYPEHDLLPKHIRPNFYEIWLWLHKKPIIKGNVTINVTVHG